MSFRYDDVHPTLGNYALRLAGGYYRQFINQYDLTSFGTTSAAPSILFWLPIDKSLNPPAAYHLAFEFLLSPGQHWRFNLEAFAKWQEVLTLDYANIQQFSPLEAGGAQVNALQNQFIQRADGRTFGAGLQIERKAANFQLTAGYDYVEALQQFPDRFGGDQIAVPWNTPNQLSLDARANVTDNLTLEANWTNQWGRRWGLRRAYYDFIAFRPLGLSTSPFNFDRPLDHKLPSYQRLDVGASISFLSDRIKTNLQLFVINVLDQENVYDQVLSLSEAGSSLSPRNLPGRQFTLSVRVDY